MFSADIDELGIIVCRVPYLTCFIKNSEISLKVCSRGDWEDQNREVNVQTAERLCTHFIELISVVVFLV
jgi:hypothetical protein